MLYTCKLARTSPVYTTAGVARLGAAAQIWANDLIFLGLLGLEFSALNLAPWVFRQTNVLYNVYAGMSNLVSIKRQLFGASMDQSAK